MMEPARERSLASLRVLVTGASGFVGRHVRPVLEARGATVIGLGTEAVSPDPALGQWVRADLTDATAVAAAFLEAKPDAVLHLAGQSSAGLSFEAPERTFQINAGGTWNVLDAARQHARDARLLVIGTGECYGPQPGGSRTSEDAPMHPVSPYAFSKAASDAMAEVCGNAWGLDIVRTRSFSHAGPGQDRRFALPSFALQIAALERGGEGGVIRVGNLDVIRDIVDVRDVVEAYVLLLERGAPGTAYNVCGGVPVSLRGLVERMTGLARVPVHLEVDPARFRPADVPFLVGDPRRIRAATGWAPQRDLDVMLEDLLDEHRRRLSTG